MYDPYPTIVHTMEEDQDYEDNLEEMVAGMRLVDVKPDGNCLFRSIVASLSGDEDKYSVATNVEAAGMRENLAEVMTGLGPDWPVPWTTDTTLKDALIEPDSAEVMGSGLTFEEYLFKLRYDLGFYPGTIEIGILSEIHELNIYVFVRSGRKYKLVAEFEKPDFTKDVYLFNEGMHYQFFSDFDTEDMDRRASDLLAKDAEMARRLQQEDDEFEAGLRRVMLSATDAKLAKRLQQTYESELADHRLAASLQQKQDEERADFWLAGSLQREEEDDAW